MRFADKSDVIQLLEGDKVKLIEIIDSHNFFEFHLHCKEILQGVDKYYLSDQLHLSQGILRKKENERDNVSLRNAVSMIVILTEFIQLHARNEPLLLYPFVRLSVSVKKTLEIHTAVGLRDSQCDGRLSDMKSLKHFFYGDTSAGGSLSFDLETIGEGEEVLERHRASVEELCDQRNLITYLNLRLNKNSSFFSPELCDVYIRISGLGNK
ncbi:hypothetical protein G5I_14694 [Acromyrmex echinatior]|uniref:Uncharacterized protein n=1 Tax=Acromyrmex echinatior TaxID=103372 RepID=F4X8F5_ACREC|nr:hypothetical protein G5I_14694 [Acromyrmex echinatior]